MELGLAATGEQPICCVVPSGERIITAGTDTSKRIDRNPLSRRVQGRLARARCGGWIPRLGLLTVGIGTLEPGRHVVRRILFPGQSRQPSGILHKSFNEPNGSPRSGRAEASWYVS